MSWTKDYYVILFGKTPKGNALASLVKAYWFSTQSQAMQQLLIVNENNSKGDNENIDFTYFCSEMHICRLQQLLPGLDPSYLFQCHPKLKSHHG